jgi:hypothetical protein
MQVRNPKLATINHIGAKSHKELLALAEVGDANKVDKLVGLGFRV